MISYNKLVRDKIPEILDEKGVKYEKHIASKGEFKLELMKKLEEEVGEFKVLGEVEELADIIEVIETLKQFTEYKNVEKLRFKKKKERGGFEKHIILKGEK